MMESKGKRRAAPEKRTVEKANKGSNNTAVIFSFDAPGAKEVYLAGTFNNWDVRALPMKDIDGKQKISAAW